MTDSTLGFYDTTDLREAARSRLPKGLFEFMDRGNDDEIAMRDNRAVMASIKLKPRVLNDVSVRDQAITLFGKPQKMPVIVAPGCRTTLTPLTSPPVTVSGTRANCGVSQSSPRARSR